MIYARVAQLVEHDLAKVGVAGSSPVSRSSGELEESLISQAFLVFLISPYKFWTDTDMNSLKLLNII